MRKRLSYECAMWNDAKYSQNVTLMPKPIIILGIPQECSLNYALHTTHYEVIKRSDRHNGQTAIDG